MKRIGFSCNSWVLIIIYIFTIILFSLIYMLLPYGVFDIKTQLGYIDWLYFSTITITTLGYGDIVPVDVITKLLTSLESILGLLLLGLFLNKKALEVIEKRDRKYAANAVVLSFRMLEFLETHLSGALDQKTNPNKNYKEIFQTLADNLLLYPHTFKFSKRILDNIEWGAVNSRIILFLVPAIFSPENVLGNHKIPQYLCA